MQRISLLGTYFAVVTVLAVSTGLPGTPSANAAGSSESTHIWLDANDAKRQKRINRVVKRLFPAAASLCRPTTDCHHPAVLLEDSHGLNAHARADRVTISRALVDLSHTDDQLALVLAHELAHLLLGHTGGDQGAAAMSLADSVLRDGESQADYIGLYMLARAGFDPRQAMALWHQLGAAAPKMVDGGIHPGLAERFRMLQAVCAEIETKQRTGRPLIPEFQPG